MIELIFVIVIIGVLATVAIPRFFSVENEAEDSIASAFASTMYRTVGHSFWSKSLSVGANGSIKADNDGNDSKFYGMSLDEYVTVPKYFDLSTVNFSRCVSSGVAQPFLQKTNNGKYNLFCRDGNTTSAPLFEVSTNNTYTFN